MTNSNFGESVCLAEKSVMLFTNQIQYYGVCRALESWMDLCKLMEGSKIASEASGKKQFGKKIKKNLKG